MAKMRDGRRRKAIEAFVEGGPGFYAAGHLPDEAAAPEPCDGRPSQGAELLAGAGWSHPAGEDTERLTVLMPAKLADGAKRAARGRGMTLAEFIARALKREIKRTKKKLENE